MRFRPLLLCLPALLAACTKTGTPPVQLDLIGASGLTSGSRTASPSDTLTTRLYAVGNSDSLHRLRIVVTYGPGLAPIAYPTPISAFDPNNAPAAQEIVYLDSLIKPIFVKPTTQNNVPPGGEYLFNNSFSTRTTSGTETWQYTVSDNRQESASRAYRLTVHQSDSALAYHRYAALLRPVPQLDTTRRARFARPASRVFLNLRSGLLLPKYAVLSLAPSVQPSMKDNQALVDLIALSSNGNSVSLSSPSDTRVLKLNQTRWPNLRATVLKSTRLNDVSFGNISTGAALASAFTSGTYFSSAAAPADSTNTGPLAKNQVIAFRVRDADNNIYNGLLLVTNVVLGTSPTVSCTVKVQKAP